jgi:excisionase family DNA binding protein
LPETTLVADADGKTLVQPVATQAAALVGVSDERLKVEVASGRLAGRQIGRTWRFSRNALMAWLEERPADA